MKTVKLIASTVLLLVISLFVFPPPVFAYESEGAVTSKSDAYIPPGAATAAVRTTVTTESSAQTDLKLLRELESIDRELNQFADGKINMWHWVDAENDRVVFQAVEQSVLNAAKAFCEDKGINTSLVSWELLIPEDGKAAAAVSAEGGGSGSHQTGRSVTVILIVLVAILAGLAGLAIVYGISKRQVRKRNE